MALYSMDADDDIDACLVVVDGDGGGDGGDDGDGCPADAAAYSAMPDNLRARNKPPAGDFRVNGGFYLNPSRFKKEHNPGARLLFKKQRKLRIFSIFLYIAAAANSVSHRLSSNGKLRQAGLRNRRDNGEKEEEEEEGGAAVGNSIDANNRPIALRAFTVHTGGKEREREREHKGHDNVSI